MDSFDIIMIILGFLVIIAIFVIDYIWIKKSSASKIQYMVLIGYTLILIWVIFSIPYKILELSHKSWNYKIISDCAIILSGFFLTSTVSQIFYDKFSILRSIYFAILFTIELAFNSFIKYDLFSTSEFIIFMSEIYILAIPIGLLILILSDFKENEVRNDELSYENLELLTFKNSTYLLILTFPIFSLKFVFPEFPLLIGYLFVIFIICIRSIYDLVRIDRITFFRISNYFHIIIRTDVGGLIYYKQFVDNADSDVKVLLSNWLSAFSNVISEFFKMEMRPLEIMLQNNIKIIFHWERGFYIAIVSDTISPLILPAMKNLSESISQFINHNTFDKKSEIKIDKYVRKYFEFAI